MYTDSCRYSFKKGYSYLQKWIQEERAKIWFQSVINSVMLEEVIRSSGISVCDFMYLLIYNLGSIERKFLL